MKKLGALLGVLFIIFYINFVSAAVLTVCPSGCNSTTIQGAINLASDGDTINVSAGTYSENIIINKQLTVQAASSPILTPTDTTNGGVVVDADGVIFEGFTIRDFTDSSSENKIIRINSNNNTIRNNILQGNLNQIGISDQTEYGFLIYGSNNKIKENEIYDIGYIGINIVGQPHSNASNNSVENNIIYNIGIYAIGLDRTSNNTITKNNLSSVVGGTLWGGYYDPIVWSWGIIIWGKNGTRNKITEQDLIGLPNGVVISSGNNNLIEKSKISNNDNIGIKLSPSSWASGVVEDNTIINNIISDNNIGIFVGPDSYDGIGENNIVNYNSIYGNNIGLNNTAAEEINATYNYWGSCDGPSGIGPGSGDKVYGNINFTPWLGICITNKTNVTCAIETNDVTLKANLSGLEIQDVWFSYKINSTNKNKTATNIGENKYQIIIPSTELIGGFNVTWNVYANDSFGKIYNNSWKTFYVRKRTKLNINPVSPDGLNNWYVTEPLFSLLKDSNGSNIYYQWDSDDIFLYTTPFGLENIPNPPKESAGILELNWWTDFGFCGNESKQTNIYHVDLTNPLITDLIPENASTVFNNLKPKIYAYLDEVYGSNSGINKTSVIIKVDGIDVTSNSIIKNADTLDATINYTPTTDLPVGLHNITINVTDNAGRDSELSWFFNINLTGEIFNLTVYSPENKNYSTKKVVFNITTSEIVSEIKYTNLNDQPLRYRILCRNCNESGFSRKRTQTLNEGENNITIKAVDIYGRVKEENLSLFIDSRKPQVIRQEPKNNGYCNGNFSVKYSEEYLKNVYLYYENNNSVKNDCLSGRNKECKFYVPLTQYENQSINFHFEVEDMFWKVPYRRNHTCLVDTIPPHILDITEPVNESDYTKYVYFNITLDSKAKSLKYIDENDGKITESTLCLRCSEYGASITKKKLFLKGDHIMTITAEDEAGNTDTENIIFTVN